MCYPVLSRKFYPGLHFSQELFTSFPDKSYHQAYLGNTEPHDLSEFTAGCFHQPKTLCGSSSRMNLLPVSVSEYLACLCGTRCDPEALLQPSVPRHSPEPLFYKYNLLLHNGWHCSRLLFTIDMVLNY